MPRAPFSVMPLVSRTRRAIADAYAVHEHGKPATTATGYELAPLSVYASYNEYASSASPNRSRPPAIWNGGLARA